MIVPVNEWSVQQWAGVDLGDRRRTVRAVEIGAKMGRPPGRIVALSDAIFRRVERCVPLAE